MKHFAHVDCVYVEYVLVACTLLVSWLCAFSMSEYIYCWFILSSSCYYVNIPSN